MFLIVRNILDKLLPSSLRYSLVRKLPNIEIFLASSFRGIDKVWMRDYAFRKAYDESKNRSLLDIKKAYVLYLCAKNATRIDGLFAEFGVFKGASSKLMLEGSKRKKKILLFDTFEGLPHVNKHFDNYWDQGSLRDVDINEIRIFLKEKNFEFHQGYFPKSARNLSKNLKYSLVHIDFDLFQSTVDALKYCYDKMSPSGIILIDDYGVLACSGVKKAVDDFFNDKPEMVIPNLNGQCIIIKL